MPKDLGRDLGFGESWTGTLALDGELAATLMHGGAYERFKGTASEAKGLAGAFVEALVGVSLGHEIAIEETRQAMLLTVPAADYGGTAARLKRELADTFPDLRIVVIRAGRDPGDIRFV